MKKKKETNNQIKSKINEKSSKKQNEEKINLYQKKYPKLKVNLSSSLKLVSKRKNIKKQKENTIKPHLSSKRIILNNLKKYNSEPEINNIIIITNLINCKPNHFLAIFKDYLINDYIEEFLRRIYFINESIDRLPKLYNYYKNYLHFFCKPTFSDNFSNLIIKNYADFHAENFYKNHIEKKNKDKNNINLNENDDELNNKENNNYTNTNEELIKTIFTKSIKNSIDKINDEECNFKKIINRISEFKNDIKEESKISFDKNNKISEGNTLLFMINEIKELKEFNNKQKINEKTLNMKKNNIKHNKNYSIESYKSLIKSNRNLNIKKTDNNYNKNKINTLSNIKFVDSIKNLVSPEKTKKLEKNKIKKNITTKTNKTLSKKNTYKNTLSSTMANLNININSKFNNIKKNGNSINRNKYKSPKNTSNTKIIHLSPLILNILNDKECSKIKEPLTSRINKDKTEPNNYIKIIKRKKNNDNNCKMLTTTNKNKKMFEFKKIKSLELMDFNNESKNKHNNSYNKVIFSYNNKNSTSKNKNKKVRYRNINNEYSISKGHFELFTRYPTINKTISNSLSNFGMGTKYTNSMKNMIKVNEIKNKKTAFQIKKYRGIFSPSYKTNSNKNFSFKKLNNININTNLN